MLGGENDNDHNNIDGGDCDVCGDDKDDGIDNNIDDYCNDCGGDCRMSGPCRRSPFSSGNHVGPASHCGS